MIDFAVNFYTGDNFGDLLFVSSRTEPIQEKNLVQKKIVCL